MQIKKHINDNVDPKDLIVEIVKGNKEYRDENKAHFLSLKSGQKPDITLVTCCDSRVSADIFGVDSLNEVFTIRNIGNQFRHSEGSIKYSLIHLKTPLLIIMGHTGCGAIQAAMGDYTEEDDAIQREVIGLKNSLRRTKEYKVKSEDPVLQNSMNSEINVDHQIIKVISEFNIKPLIERGNLIVIGMMFDIHNVYDVDNAHFHIINVNGETNISKLIHHPLFEKLSGKEKKHYIRRLVRTKI